MNNEKPNLYGLPNNEAFYNLLSSDNVEGELWEFFSKLQAFPHYDEDFKVFDQYIRTYKDRLGIFMDFHNNHADENLFIEEELSKLSVLKCFHLRLEWEPELVDSIRVFEIGKLKSDIITDDPFEEVFKEEHTGILTEIYTYLNNQQGEIFGYLNKLKELIAKESKPLDIENSAASQESYVDMKMVELQETKTYRLKVLERAGILKFLHDKFTERDGKSYAKLLDKILNIEGGDTAGETRDYFANVEPSESNRRDFRRSKKDYDEIENFLDKHFSKRP
ncbi:hypothetical protein N9P12_03345 [Bacteroidia bacterium]|nr:hypothetical protein [Bacteroidia bacterium]